MDKIAVMVPCYNEGKTIARVVADFRKVLPDSVIYVYDNNSTDDTAKKAHKAGATVRYVAQQGKGNVIRRMFREIDAECYILVDGDGTYFAKDALGMVDKVLNDNVDMVIGDRLSSTYYKENGHFRLQPENDTMAPIILDKVSILGKVIGLYRKF